MNHPQPRRIARTTRYGIAAVMGVLVTVVLAYFIPRIDEGGPGPWIAIVTMVVGITVVALTVGNVGFMPRIQGQYLEVSSMLGRQSLDLAALTGVRWERGRHGNVMLRLRDQLTEVAVSVPLPPAVHQVLREALYAAGQRGVVLPTRVTTLFNLPPMPGAPRNGYNNLPMILGFVAGAALLGFVASMLVTS